MPAGIVEEEIAIASGDFSLPATLSRPGKRRFGPPADSGSRLRPSGQDETIGPNKPFQEIA